MTWWVVWLVTAGVGPVSYLELLWAVLVAGTTYYLSGELWDACIQKKLARNPAQRMIAERDYWVEVAASVHQAVWALLGLVAMATPPAPDVYTEPRRVVGALVFTGALLFIQVTNLAAASYRRANRLRITRLLRTPPGVGITVVPMVGGKRAYDIPAIDAED